VRPHVQVASRPVDVAGDGAPDRGRVTLDEVNETVKLTLSTPTGGAALLVDHAALLFPAEIVHDSGWIVRLQPPPTGWSWVSALVSLVEDWLESVPLPCVKVLHGGRDYLFRAPSGLAQAAAEQEPASVRAGADMA
jgi:hypothetical protein